MLMKNPPHPGRVVRQECLEPLGLTVTAAAKGLGVTRKALSELLNGRAGISPEMAIRLAKAFGGRAEVWLGMQTDYDLARAMKRAHRIKVARIKVARIKRDHLARAA
ncbi:MAG: HigA family addiction module antidote protein [Acidimicrobiia bacterium]|nr:HigA family addiction module antidote protein [Acidimicrobiia bacterium]